jgi:hypothetical protein
MTGRCFPDGVLAFLGVATKRFCQWQSNTAVADVAFR